MEAPNVNRNRTLLPAVSAIFLGLFLADILKLWLSPNWAQALAFFLGTLSLGLARKLQLSWRYLILLGLGLGVFALVSSAVLDLFHQ